MISVRKAEDRGATKIAWLDSKHTFSFGEYYDPSNMGFRSLRVINDDRVAPAGGFGTHSHRDMEIITYVLEGALEHRDSLGTGSVIRPGDVQKMSAGTGIAHSEFNHSKTEPVHFLQIWIVPSRSGIAPAYDQVAFSHESKSGKLKLVAGDVGEGIIRINQDVKMYATELEGSQAVKHSLAANRHAWVHVARGSAVVNGKTLGDGDGASITQEDEITITAAPKAEVLLFDLG
jgi:redox-sensitive bicupin YhaK (pirin superfamily)